MAVLTAIDVLGVQRFVFSSNRLQDTVGASWLVHWSTSRDGALRDFVPEKDIVLGGGGNAIIEFASLERAREFTARYTRRMYDEVPGLEVVVAHKSFNPGGLARALLEIQIELARQKTERVPTAPLMGISVTATCRETGLPATGFDSSDRTVPLSKGILKRRSEIAGAGKRWSPFLQNYPAFDFPLELDRLGRSYGDTSVIGVVHVDGNKVGQRIKRWLSGAEENGVSDDEVRRQCQAWSEAIDKLGTEALHRIVERVCSSVEKSDEDGKESRRIAGTPESLTFELAQANGKWMLPLRPILLGGDDLTFVCDGRIALDLAETALSTFDASDIPHLGKITACAGVAIVPVHAPFMRAYELSENLCSSAKQMLTNSRNDDDCALDWHIGTSRPNEMVRNIRERQYQANSCALTCRPYRLGKSEDEPETWRWLSKTLLGNSDAGLHGGQWSKRRSKAKAFLDLVRDGPDAVRTALGAWRAIHKNLRLPPEIDTDGFFRGASTRTPLQDAVELMDVHLALRTTTGDQGNKEK